MRVDLTVCDAAGANTDIAVLSRDPVTLGDVAASAPGLLPAEVWNGDERLDARTVVGGPAICTGATLRPWYTPRLPRTGVAVRVTGGRDAGLCRPLSDTPLVVGRDPACDIVLTDPDVSRRHLLITPSEPAALVRDLGSTNGTTIDGTAVDGSDVRMLHSSVMRAGDSHLCIDHDTIGPGAADAGAGGVIRVNRPPQPAASVPDGPAIAIPDALADAPPTRVPWLAAAVPALLGVALAVVMHSPEYLLFALMSPVLAVATGVGDRVHGRCATRRARAEYRRDRAEADVAIASGLAAERAERAAAHPDPAHLGRVAELRSMRLWEGRSEAGIRVRVGLGTVVSRLQVRDSDGVRPAADLDHQPVTIDLAGGGAGIVAPNGSAPRLARWLVAQLAIRYSPTEIELWVALDRSTAPRWEWLRWLPHLRGRVATDPPAAARLVHELHDKFDRRRAAARRDPAEALRWIVLVVDVGDDPAELPGLSALIRDGPRHAITAICVSQSTATLPDGCMALLVVEGETGSRATLTGDAGPARHVILDQVSRCWADAMARALAPCADTAAPTDDMLPDTCRLPGLYGVERLTTQLLHDRWSRHRLGAHCVIGAGPDGPVSIDLVRDGPHALVAGTTGAGKSELLQTLVAGLAVEHSPDDMCFVLVDYKGGAAFGECARLPHVTAVVTDLDAHLTRRALRSLRAELRRRERRLAEASASDLAGYRALGTGEALPRLIIVVDEFAALADELPDFVTGLVGVAQRGRSLGVHLVLATQRPGGVVSPQIRANCALRIALRVLDPAESADLLGDAAAARLDPGRPGRAYLVRGLAPELLQVAHVTAPAEAQAVRVIRLDRWRRLLPVLDDAPASTDLDDVIAAADTVVGDLGLAPPSRPWLAPLPPAVSAADLLDRYANTPTTCLLGLLDQPDAQRQDVEGIELAEGGGLLFVGSARSGRTSALLFIALSAARSRPPTELQLYGLDFAGGTLGWLRPLPHVGAVTDDDPAAAAALLRALEARVGERQARLAALGCASVAELPPGTRGFPALLLTLDGWEAFARASEELDHGGSVERLGGLLRAGPRAGLTILVTGDRAACTPRLAGLMRERYVLRLADHNDYALAGLPPAHVPIAPSPGRAIRASDGSELLIAHPGADATPTATRTAIQELARRYANDDQTASSGEPLITLRPLPTTVALADLQPGGDAIMLGRAGADAAPVRIDPLAGAGRVLVAGPSRSGRSTVLRLILAQRERVRVPIVVAAPHHSPVRRDAASSGIACLDPGDSATRVHELLSEPALVLVDDVETFLDTAVGDALHAAARADPRLALIVAGRSDELLVTYRGVVAEARRSRCAVVLQPAPGDLELVGERPSRGPPVTTPGRGLLRADPDTCPELGAGLFPIQIAVP